MTKRLYRSLLSWPKNFISTTDLASVTGRQSNALHSLVHRALLDKGLVRLRRGLFLISPLFSKKLADNFELSGLLYSPSFVSLQSALSYHGAIPEAVYATTCVTTRRSKVFINPLSTFSYHKVPQRNFMVGVYRIADESGVYFMATFWRAIADLIYVCRKEWPCLEAMSQDMRIETIPSGPEDKNGLKELADVYPSARTRRILKKFSLEL